MKTLVESGQYGSIVDLGKDGTNPEVLIKGFGSMLLSQLKERIIRKLETAITYTKQNNTKAMRYTVFEEMPHFIQALVDVENELQSPAVKRKIFKLKK